ncbi:MAG TPA: amidohydrolase family protein [Candidatus Sulfotelmatobacter sp.]|nr:amidohydrolase family protein [Candidatus Sulfotelmatobacter sp.]
MALTHFVNAKLFDGITPELQEGAEVLVEGERIKEVSGKPIRAAGARRIDVGGRTLMPGLIDAHFHAVAADSNIAKLETMPRSLIAQYSRRFLEAALQRGFTSVRDAGGADYGLAQAVNIGFIDGPRLFYCGKALTQTGGHGDARSYEQPLPCSCCQGSAAISQVADGVDEVRRAARDELRKGASQIKIMASGGVASPSDPIWNLQYSEEEIRAVVWEAHSWRAYVMAHAYTPEAIRRCVSYGVRSIEHANLIDAETARFVAEKGAFVVPTLVTYDALDKFGRQQGFPEVSMQKLEVVRAAGLKSLDHLKAAGVRMGFGTDLLAEMHEHQSREFSIRAEALPPVEILLSATSVNAELLQRKGELGVIAAGALADLIVVDGNPLQKIALLEDQGRHLPVIVKGGKIYKNTLK